MRLPSVWLQPFALLMVTAMLHAQEPGRTARLGEAMTHSARGEHDTAAQMLEGLVQETPGVESIKFRLAVERVHQRRWDEAEKLFSELLFSTNAAMVRMARIALGGIAQERIRLRAQKLREDAYRRKEAAMRAAQVRREEHQRMRERDLARRQEILDLFSAGRNAEGLERLSAYESTQPLPAELVYAGIYALEREGRHREAVARFDSLPADEQSSGRGLLVRGRLARTQGQMQRAWEDFSAARTAARGTPLEHEIQEEIRALPKEADLDRWAWGELQGEGVFLSRFSDTIFYGQLREGTFVPGARWIQPFVQADLTMDTKSGASEGLSEVYAHNLAGLHAGVRVRPFAHESVWLYGLVGLQKDLRGTTRFDGSWFLDWQVGLRAFKGLGPGLRLGDTSGLMTWTPVRPRAAWFLEGGFDAAWYSLYENFLAYFELREGFRVLDFGTRAGLDFYLTQRGTLDSEGLYYNNFVEGGGGMRVTVRVRPGLRFVLRLEGFGGAYLGRDAQNSRGDQGATYGDLRATAALWADW